MITALLLAYILTGCACAITYSVLVMFSPGSATAGSLVRSAIVIVLLWLPLNLLVTIEAHRGGKAS